MLQKKWQYLTGFLCMFLLLTFLPMPAGADYFFGDMKPFSFTFSTNQPLEDVFLFTGSEIEPTESGIDGSIYPFFIGEVPSGNTTYTLYIPEYMSAYTVIGLYDYDNNGVTVLMPSVPTGMSWDQYFNPGVYDDWADFSENEVANQLKTLNKSFPPGPQPLYLEDFYATYYLDGGSGFIGGPWGTSLKLVNFTDATLGGSVYAAAVSVPEPATMLLLGPGLVGLAGVKRKFNK